MTETPTGFDVVHHVALKNDLDLAYRSVGEGPTTIVLLHGWPTSSYTWRGVIERLSAGHRVIAPDLVGFGGSAKPPDVDYDFVFHERIVEELLEVMGIGPVAVVGHDIGGAIAAHWAIDQSERVSAVALLNTVLFPDLFGPEVAAFVASCQSPSESKKLTSRSGIADILHHGVANPASMPPSLVDVYADPYDSDDKRAALARAGSGLGLGGFEMIARRAIELTIPVCAVYGEQDEVLGDVAPTFERLRREVAGTEVLAVPDAGHFVQEDRPDQVGERLAEFFQRALDAPR